MELKEYLFERLKEASGLRAFEYEGEIFLAHHTPRKIDNYRVQDLAGLMNLPFPLKRGRTGISKEMMKHLQFLN